jgi:uncharacterized protein (TIGR03067 family)
MQRLISVMCGLILATGLVLAGAGPAAAQATLQGSWTATKAERDGKAAADVVGHRLTFTGDRFEIRSKDGRTVVYTGTFRTDQNAKPASIDFVNTEGTDKGKTWKGIYAFDGDTLTTCDNAPDVAKARPTAFEAKSGSGHILVTFARAAVIRRTPSTVAMKALRGSVTAPPPLRSISSAIRCSACRPAGVSAR